ncbi:MAG: hypothetical protein FJW40_08200 [Acidobacteria bacterium]|nr:hypothetical protein [Acidobacteriota bacterium]
MHYSVAAAAVLAGMAGVALGAPVVEAYAGAVAGQTNFGPKCTTYGVQEPIPKAFFGGVSTPLGGLAACGYGGGISDVTAGGGMVSTSQSVTRNWDLSGFSGDGASSAQSGMLASSASGRMTGPTSSTYLHNAGGFSRFLEPAKFTTAGIADGMSGFLELLFTVEGRSEHGFNPPYTSEIISSLFLRIRPGDQPRAVFYLKLSNGSSSLTTEPVVDNITRSAGKASYMYSPGRMQGG